MKAAGKRFLHRVFEASILIKGVFAAFETLVGIMLTTPLSLRALRFLHETELHQLIADPDDRLAGVLVRHLSGVQSGHLHFWAIYLIGHGLVKLVVVTALARGWYSAYSFAMLVLGGFIAWQMFDWWQTGGPVMLALSAFDAFVIWLTWREWKTRKA